METGPSAVVTRGLTKRYGDITAGDGISFTLFITPMFFCAIFLPLSLVAMRRRLIK